MIYVLALLLWIALAAQSAFEHQWANFAGYTLVALVFLIIPTLGMKRLGRVPRRRKPPDPPRLVRAEPPQE